jgi:hypothetical protein
VNLLLSLHNPALSGPLGLEARLGSLGLDIVKVGASPFYASFFSSLGPFIWPYFEGGFGIDPTGGVGPSNVGFLGSVPTMDLFGGDSSCFLPSIESFQSISCGKGDLQV